MLSSNDHHFSNNNFNTIYVIVLCFVVKIYYLVFSLDGYDIFMFNIPFSMKNTGKSFTFHLVSFNRYVPTGRWGIDLQMAAESHYGGKLSTRLCEHTRINIYFQTYIGSEYLMPCISLYILNAYGLGFKRRKTDVIPLTPFVECG